MDLSFIIPARQEKYLEDTIKNILINIRGDSEILVALDGYEPEPPILINDPRVRFFPFPTAIGQRASINYLVKQSEAKYIMKIDAHCAIDEGMDIKLMGNCEYDWTVIPRMYNLDIKTFTPKMHKITDYMYISSPTAEKPFRPQYFEGRQKDERRRQPRNDKIIDDTMCCMGCGWFMHRERFWEQGGCDENHKGGWGQQSVEVSLKAWLSGGSLKVNKSTWFSHWFRGDVGFPYQISGKQIDEVREYSRDLWLNDKWPLAKRKLQWVIDKFDPPGWIKNNKNLSLNLKKENNLKKLPYKDNEIEHIISEDLIERFSKQEINSILKEWLRILKKNGTIEIQTIDTRRTLERWTTLEWDKLSDALVGSQKTEHNCNRIIFDKESFRQYLEKAGFKVLKINRFSTGNVPKMRAICTKIV